MEIWAGGRTEMGCNESKNIDQGVQRNHVLMSCNAQDNKHDEKPSTNREVSPAEMNEHVTNEEKSEKGDSFIIKEKLPAIKEDAESEDDSIDESFYSIDLESCSFFELSLDHSSEEESSPKVTLTRNKSPKNL